MPALLACPRAARCGRSSAAPQRQAGRGRRPAGGLDRQPEPVGHPRRGHRHHHRHGHQHQRRDLDRRQRLPRAAQRQPPDDHGRRARRGRPGARRPGDRRARPRPSPTTSATSARWRGALRAARPARAAARHPRACTGSACTRWAATPKAATPSATAGRAPSSRSCAGTKQVPTALVLQLRNRVQHAADGTRRPHRPVGHHARPRGPAALARRDGGRRRRPALTWLVDPAVIGARHRPRRRQPGPAAAARPTRRRRGRAHEGQDGQRAERADPRRPRRLQPAGARRGGARRPRRPRTRDAGRSRRRPARPGWPGCRTALAGKELLALPYGDVDASAASHLDPRARPTRRPCRRP